MLIDGDNTTPTIIEALLAEIQPMQQFAYTTGKNATDSALIIDAMDLLYTGNMDGFCLVSSDIDFTKLVSGLYASVGESTCQKRAR